MRVFALADPHLSLAIPGKEQDKFGDQWRNHAAKIASGWRRRVSEDDLVLVAGDISWALRLADALCDLRFLNSLPGTKVLVKGNHDYWWKSLSQLRAALPPRMLAVQGDAVRVGPVVVCGTRLWDVPGVCFDHLIDWNPSFTSPDSETKVTDDVRIYQREVVRLERALADAARLRDETEASEIVVMTHYPPCDGELHSNELTRLLELRGIRHVVFGHLHSLRPGIRPFGVKRGVHYHLTACDFLDFVPLRITEVSSAPASSP
jgi:predicted phosphohydrolase